MNHQRTKHIKVDCKYTREFFDDKFITPHVTTDSQVADIFTKVILCVRHYFFVGKFIIVDSPSSIYGGEINLKFGDQMWGTKFGLL